MDRHPKFFGVLSTLNLFSFAFVSLFCKFVNMSVKILSLLFCALIFRCIDVCEICMCWLILLLFGSTVRSGHNLGGWRCRLSLSMFLLTISVGRF